MDYKEKYEMALEGIQEILSSGEDSIKMSRLQLRLQGIFPELKESEDEKIRKELIDFLEYYRLNNVLDSKTISLLTDSVAWLEKQGEQKFMPQEYADAFDEFMSHIPEKEPEFSESCYNYDDMVSAIQFGIKWQQQHDSIVKVKPKYEPKFHKGDWVIGRATENEPRQIAEITEDGYKSTYGGWYGFSFEEDMHLWTIKDAKDGDVLFQNLMGGKTFIYNGVNPDMAILYSFIISNDGEDVLPYHIGKPNTGIGNIEENKNIIHPATKEQRDLLFQKMKEAGYEWDDDKKELKKVENKNPLLSDFFKAEYERGKADAKKPAWSEEDEKTWKELIEEVKDQLDSIPAPDCRDKEDEKVLKQLNKWYTWLKSISPQSQWKPSDEQLRELRCVISGCSFETPILVQLEEDLKKLL